MTPILPIGVWGTDVYRAAAWLLNSDGSPAAPDTSVYSGLDFHGVQDFIPSTPSPRSVIGLAQGMVMDTIYLPSNTARTATMHTLYDLMSENAVLAGVKRVSEGGLDYVPTDTDKEGQEPLVALLVSQLISHDDEGLSLWHSYFYPRARVIPSQMVAMNQNASQYLYNISLSRSKKLFWGPALSVATQGTKQAGGFDIVTTDRLDFAVFKADGVVDDFLFDTDKQCVNHADVKVWDYAAGTQLTTGVTVDAAGIHFSAGHIPTSGKIIVAPYQF